MIGASTATVRMLLGADDGIFDINTNEIGQSPTEFLQLLASSPAAIFDGPENVTSCPAHPTAVDQMAEYGHGPNQDKTFGRYLELMTTLLKVVLVPRKTTDSQVELLDTSHRVDKTIRLVSKDGGQWDVDVIGTWVSKKGVEALVIPKQGILVTFIILLLVCGFLTFLFSVFSTPTVPKVLSAWLAGPVFWALAFWTTRRFHLRYLRKAFRQGTFDETTYVTSDARLDG